MRIGIALGSNLGDRLANLRFGRDEIKGQLSPTKLTSSSIYETEPVNCPPNSPAFLNAVIELNTDSPLAPKELLSITQSIEKQAGRVESNQPNAPRPLDLDILYMDDLVISLPELEIPHPRLHERAFVLAPLNDLQPDLLLPNHSNPVSALWNQLPEDDKLSATLYCQEW